jgi:glucose/arabinose dehydrogenase
VAISQLRFLHNGGQLKRRERDPARAANEKEHRMTMSGLCRRSLVALCMALASLAGSCGQGSDHDPEQVASVGLGLTVPSGFSDQVVATGLASPTAMAFAPDGRIFVCQQGGQLRVVKNGALLTTPFLTVPTTSSGERGLLGVAFHPSFASNGFVYVYYTVTSPVHNRVSRFTASGDVAVPGSETVIMDLDGLSSATNHNGGAMHFGPDGKLYVAVGENANRNNAQVFTNRLGKILRVNADGSIPSDNPFFSTASGLNRSIWALGLRNPFTFAFQPGTGRMFINDVGEVTWEEINDGIAGSNYGWPTTEGTTTDPRFRSPLLVYAHGTGAATGCAITGGAFYNPATPQFPSSFVNKYFYADYCGNWIRVFDPAAGTSQSFATALSSPVDLKVGPDGLLYYLMRGSSGTLGRIRSTANQPPSITTQPASRTAAIGQQVTFTVNATGTQPLSYQWQRGGANISGATSSSYTLTAQASDNGATFRVIVTNAFGTATSNAATLTVTSNAAPTATIVTPAAGTLYSAGDTINYSGNGTDPEDGTLPASAFTWEVVFHHDTHTHPFLAPTSGARSGSFVIPKLGEVATNVFYRIHLTVRDSSGLTHSVFRDIAPRVSTITLQTNPTGLQLTLDGTPVTAPASIASVVGMTRTLGVVSPQTLGSTTYTFSAWSDAGAASHAIDVPSANTTYTATFSPSSGPTFPIRINFQPSGASTPSGYVADTGLVFGTRSGLSFGWNVDHTDVTRDRGVNANQLLDTLCHFHSAARWELALPNGSYSVLASIGDPSYASTYTLTVEGVTYWNATNLDINQFLSDTRSVSVNDGRLTLTQGNATDKATRINYIVVSQP